MQRRIPLRPNRTINVLHTNLREILRYALPYLFAVLNRFALPLFCFASTAQDDGPEGKGTAYNDVLLYGLVITRLYATSDRESLTRNDDCIQG